MTNLAEILQQIRVDVSAIAPIIILVAGAIIILMAGTFATQNPWVLKLLYTSTLVIVAFFIRDERVSLFGGMYQSDGLTIFLQRLFVVGGLVLMIFKLPERRKAEYLFFILALLVGAFLLLGSRHLLLLYLSLELTSFSGYFLSGFSFNQKGSESALKYALFGGISSAFTLFGMSLVYGQSGSLWLADISVGGDYALGLLMFLAGLLFKASLVPFHLWVPNVYTNATAGTAAFFSVVPKLAGMGILYQLMVLVPESTFISKVLLVVSLASVVLGTFGALTQRNARRIVAYGAIAHSGFIFPLLIIGGTQGLQAFGLYAMVYFIMAYGIFYILGILENNGLTDVQQFAGLGRKAPFFGVLTLILLIALIGLPPTAGFTAKFVLFSQVLGAYTFTADGLWMVYFVVGIISTALSLYYYLTLAYYYFLAEGVVDSPLKTTKSEIWLATFFALLLLWIFFQPKFIDTFVTSIL